MELDFNEIYEDISEENEEREEDNEDIHHETKTLNKQDSLTFLFRVFIPCVIPFRQRNQLISFQKLMYRYLLTQRKNLSIHI